MRIGRTLAQKVLDDVVIAATGLSSTQEKLGGVRLVREPTSVRARFASDAPDAALALAWPAARRLCCSDSDSVCKAMESDGTATLPAAANSSALLFLGEFCGADALPDAPPSVYALHVRVETLLNDADTANATCSGAGDTPPCRCVTCSSPGFRSKAVCEHRDQLRSECDSAIALRMAMGALVLAIASLSM